MDRCIALMTAISIFAPSAIAQQFEGGLVDSSEKSAEAGSLESKAKLDLRLPSETQLRIASGTLEDTASDEVSLACGLEDVCSLLPNEHRTRTDEDLDLMLTGAALATITGIIVYCVTEASDGCLSDDPRSPHRESF